MTDVDTIRHELSRLFAYKAEWLKGNLFDLFTRPKYLARLSDDVPCVLVGGRGTGKTTVLRGLSYSGQFELSDKSPETVKDWNHFGIYLRINTNRVTAFGGPEVTEERWQKLFSHYINLVFCDLLLEFLSWYENHAKTELVADAVQVRKFCASLCVEPASTISECRESVNFGIVNFESYINNIDDEPPVKLSLLGAPVDLLVAAIKGLPGFDERRFSFLIDEYENLNESQQQVVNTLMKHASDAYTFKIGVRELGWRCKTTLNPNEQLVSPADYRLVNITDELIRNDFDQFAEEVCNARLAMLRKDHPEVPSSIVEMFPTLGLQEEALKLGVASQVKGLASLLKKNSDENELFLAKLDPLEQYFIKCRAESSGKSLDDIVDEARQDKNWQSKYDNYAYSLLFNLKQGKRGIRKYYCGWKTFCLLANGNLRYLIELVDASISAHLILGAKLSASVSPDTQTKAAQEVGKKNLGELEGLSIHGAKLTKLLLGLGRLFGIMAGDAVGHAPEVNQFEIVGESRSKELDDLLNYGVMHLALVRLTGTKISGMDTKDYDYSVHPIFAPFFVFGHRKKRKMKLSPEEFLGLIDDTSSSLEKILAKSQRTIDQPLPDQLTLFEIYFDGNS